MRNTTRTFFDDLCELEPALRVLAEEVGAVADDLTTNYFCANEVWSLQFKPRLLALVGYNAGSDYRAKPEWLPETEMEEPMAWMDLIRVTLESVGRSAGVNPVLTSSAAYDTAYRTIYDLLPECRACGCVIAV